MIRYGLIGCVVGGLAASFAYVAGWFPNAGYGYRLSPQRIIDAFEATTHPHPGFRRNHAKGICVTGRFDSSGKAAAISRASVFAPGSYAVIGRFSAPGVNPGQPDASFKVRSFALQLNLPGYEQWRTGMNSVPIFAVGTPQAVYEQLSAQTLDASGQTNPALMDAFLRRHPEARAFENWLDSHPPSSAFFNATYFSVNVFRTVDRSGQARYVRWRVVPDDPYRPLGDKANDDPDFLDHDLVERLEHAPLRWHLMISVAKPGDPLDDATRQWANERDRDSIDAGTLVIDHAQSQIDGPCRDINFDPLILPDGIEPSNDPLLAARSSAYAVSFNRRIREEAKFDAARH